MKYKKAVSLITLIIVLAFVFVSTTAFSTPRRTHNPHYGGYCEVVVIEGISFEVCHQMGGGGR